MTPNLSNVLIGVALIAVTINYVFFPGILVGKVRKRWPGIFETNNPEPEALPTSFMLGFIVALLSIVYVGVEYGALAAVLAIYVAVFIGVVLMHGPPYVVHQWRRMRGHTPPPLEC